MLARYDPRRRTILTARPDAGRGMIASGWRGRNGTRFVVLIGRVTITSDMAAIFDQYGIRFEFPENWSVDEPEETSGAVSVTVSSPGTAFWSLGVYPASVRPTELLTEVLAAMKAEYPSLDFDETFDEIDDQRMAGYEINFICLDLCNTATVHGFQLGDSTYLLLWQAEDEEMIEVEPVFRAITLSLLNAETKQPTA